MGSLRIWNAAVSQRLDLRTTTGVGTPILTAADKLFRLENGEGLAGDYRLEFVTGTVVPGAGTGVVGAGSAQVRVVCEDISFYRHNDVFTVALDGTTPYTNIIPDVSVIFSDSPSATDLWYVTVNLGDFLGVVDAGNPLGDPPGEPILEQRFAVKNEGGTDATGCYVVLRPWAKLVRVAGDGLFKSIKVFSNSPVEKDDPITTQTLAYVMTGDNQSGGLIDVLEDGAVITSVRNMNTNVVNTSTALARDGSTRYRIESGNLTGVEFVLSATATDASQANILVFPVRYIEIAADLSGAPGTFGISDVQIGTSGYPAGTIPVGAVAYFWIRITIPATAGGQSNPHPLDVGVRYRDTGAAAWGV